VGAWPTPESLADRIVTALNESAEQAADPDERSKRQNAVKAVGGVGKEVLVRTLTNVLTGSL
jgi:hypothetical protein